MDLRDIDWTNPRGWPRNVQVLALALCVATVVVMSAAVTATGGERTPEWARNPEAVQAGQRAARDQAIVNTADCPQAVGSGFAFLNGVPESEIQDAIFGCEGCVKQWDLDGP